MSKTDYLWLATMKSKNGTVLARLIRADSASGAAGIAWRRWARYAPAGNKSGSVDVKFISKPKGS